MSLNHAVIKTDSTHQMLLESVLLRRMPGRVAAGTTVLVPVLCWYRSLAVSQAGAGQMWAEPVARLAATVMLVARTAALAAAQVLQWSGPATAAVQTRASAGQRGVRSVEAEVRPVRKTQMLAWQPAMGTVSLVSAKEIINANEMDISKCFQPGAELAPMKRHQTPRKTWTSGRELRKRQQSLAGQAG